MIDAKQVEKYVEALNNILGADNAYFRGDKDVDTIVELIQTVKSLNDERETMLKDLQFRTNQVVEQQADIEEWKKINQQLYNEMEERRKEDIGIAKGYARIEAIKEFAQSLKAKCDYYNDCYSLDYGWMIDKIAEDIDNLVKEMVGDCK